MQQADGHRLDVVRHRRHRAHRRDLGAGGVEAPLDLQPQPAGDQGLGPVGPDVVERGPVLAGDLDDVGEPGGGDQGDDRPPPLQQGVGGDRRPVGEEVRRQLPEPLAHGPAGVVRRGQDLGDPPVGHDHVGERPTGIDPAAHRRRHYGGVTDSDTLAAVERWFRSRGIPHFIDQYSASRDVFTRVLAPLTAILMLELVTALDASWPWWLNVGRGRRQPRRRARRLGGRQRGPEAAGAGPPRPGGSDGAGHLRAARARARPAGRRPAPHRPQHPPGQPGPAGPDLPRHQLRPPADHPVGRRPAVAPAGRRARPPGAGAPAAPAVRDVPVPHHRGLAGGGVARRAVPGRDHGPVRPRRRRVRRRPHPAGGRAPWPGSSRGPTWPCSWGTRRPPPSTRRPTRPPPARPASGAGSGATSASWCCSPRGCRSPS